MLLTRTTSSHRASRTTPTTNGAVIRHSRKYCAGLMTPPPLTLPPLSAHACVRLSDGASLMRQGSLPLPASGEGEGVRGHLLEAPPPSLVGARPTPSRKSQRKSGMHATRGGAAAAVPRANRQRYAPAVQSLPRSASRDRPTRRRCA